MPGRDTRLLEEREYVYTNKFLDKELRFEPVADEVVTTFDVDATAAAAEALTAVDTASIKVLNPDRGFAILQLGDEETAEGLAASVEGEDVHNVLPVMIDQDSGRRYFMPDELTVQFVESVGDEEAKAIIADHGSEVVVAQRTKGYFTISVPEGKGLFEVLREFTDLETVLFAEPSEIGVDDLLVDLRAAPGDVDLDAEADGYPDLGTGFEPDGEMLTGTDIAAIPPDPRFDELWGLHNTGQLVNGTAGTVDADIDAPQAWNITRGAATVIVAVIDTGADLDHPDLVPNLLARGADDWDFADPLDPEPWDDHSHGTHVAGTAVGAQNAHGITGVAPQARLMPLRVNLTSGMNANRADAINYVADRAAADPAHRYVINCSWKMSGDHAGVRNAIQRAVARNVVVVFAAGNVDKNIDVDPQYPAVYPEVIAVAATDQHDKRAYFPGSWGSNYGTKVDVAAPGVNVLSAIPDDTFGFMGGTSMASPHVAGLAALIWSRNPALTNAQVRTVIEQTTDGLDDKNPGFEGKLGTGRINAYRALREMPPPRLRADVVRRFRYPQANKGSSTGLAFAAQFWRPWYGYRAVLLFLTQKAYSEKIYFLDALRGQALYTVDPQANDTIGSLAWDGRAIRVANVTTGAGSINTIDPRDGRQIDSIPAPPGRGEGLAYDGRTLYYSTVSHIHALRPDTGAVMRSFPSPGGQSRSLTYGRGWLFSGNSQTGEITVFNPWTMFVHGTIQAPGGGTHRTEGIAFDERRRELFVGNQSENTIYVLRVHL